MTRIALKEVRKTLSAEFSLSSVSIEVQTGEVFGLIGPSGSGKSTILKLMAGLMVPDSGTVLIDDKLATPEMAARRGVVLVWQSLALFPHLNVGANVAFGLKVRSVGRATTRRKVARALELVGLSGFERRGLYRLSGGERQRVALARALAIDPAVVLLDEPFGSVDQHLRSEVVSRLNEIRAATNVTMVLVTHDQVEAFCVADRVGILNRGGVEQIGTAKELRAAPKTGFVAEFLGKKVVVEGLFRRESQVGVGEVEVGDKVVFARLPRPEGEDGLSRGACCAILIDPERIEIRPASAGLSNQSGLEAFTVGKVPLGGLEALEMRLFNGSRLRVPLMGGRAYDKVGGKVWVSWDVNDAQLVPF